jgi:hypothetical protein
MNSSANLIALKAFDLVGLLLDLAPITVPWGTLIISVGLYIIVIGTRKRRKNASRPAKTLKYRRPVFMQVA